MSNADVLNLKAELRRKSIHLSCTIIPILYYFACSREQILVFSCFIAIGFLIAEFARYRIQFCAQIFEKTFFSLLREKEIKRGLTGATYLFLSTSITIFIFEKEVAVPALFVLTLADSFAAITGKLKGKHKFFNKSIEGSATFFLFTLLILYIFIPESGLSVISISVLVTVIEALPVPVNDNILVPLSAGIFLTYF